MRPVLVEFCSNRRAMSISLLSSFFLPRLRVRHSPSGRWISSPRLPADVVIASVFASFLGLAMPLAVLQVYDRVLPNTSTDTLLVLMLGVAVVLVADGAIKIARAAVVSRLGATFNHQSHLELFRRVLDTDPAEFGQTPVSVHVRQLRALQSVADHYGDQGRLLAIDLPAGGIFFAALIFIGGPLAIVPVVLLGFFLFFALNRNRVLQQVVADRSEQDDRKSDFTLEVLSGAKTVKSQAMEALIMRRFERLQRHAASLSSKYMKLSGQARDAAAIFGTLTSVFVVLFGAIMVVNDSFSIGGVAASTLLAGQLVQPFLRAINQLTDMQRLKHDYSQVSELFQLPPVKARSEPEGRVDGSIQMVTVCVEPERAGGPVLADVDLRIEEGQFVSFRGGDGAGKAALMKLLTAEQAPDTGRVLVGGHDYDGPYKHALRKCVSYVDNQGAIFSGTILENITMFGAVADLANARAAARLIGLEKEIHLLPNGYETRLGSDLGGKLPTSTLQRIAIARALAGEPRILVLDEANAKLDQHAEKALIGALNRLKGQLTLVIVSQRPSMLAVADRHFEVNEGKVVPFPVNLGDATSAVRGAMV